MGSISHGQNCQKWHSCVLIVVVLSVCTQNCVGAHQLLWTDNEPHCPKLCTCSSRLKRVSCINLHLTSIPDDIPPCATELYLSRNYLTGIPRGVFRNLENLTDLSLEYNHLTQVDDGAFLGLKKLKRLTLRSNKLVRLSPGVFQDLVSLSNLYLTDNKLTAVPDVGFAHNLTYLTLDNNQLKTATIPPGFRSLSKLSTLILSNNPPLSKIKDSDFEALNSDAIRKISLVRCSFSFFGSKVFHFPHLQALDLSYNKNWDEDFLRHMIDSLQNSSRLASLKLAGVIDLPQLPVDIFASLSKVPLIQLSLAHTEQVDVIDNGTFQYFPKLRDLDLSSSSFSFLNDGSMSSMKKLELLNLHGNKQLRMIPHLGLPTLKRLVLSGCTSIIEIPSDVFYDLPKLEHLDLKQCSIHTIISGAFRGLNSLLTLNLSTNGIGGSSFPVDTFEPVSTLRVLDLSKDSLKKIEAEKNLFSSLNLLETLDMSDNKCYMLPPSMFEPLVSLKYLDLSGNHLGQVVVGPNNATINLHTLVSLDNLKLMDNGIEILPGDLFRGLSALKTVNLSKNSIDQWQSGAFNESVNLTSLDLSSNRISVVREDSMLTLPSQAKLYISNNPFACWCDMIWFRTWISSENVSDSKLPGIRTYKCNSPADMANKYFIEFDPDAIHSKCFPPPWIIIIVSTSVAVAMVVLVASVVLFRNRWFVRLRWYKFKRACRSPTARNGHYHNLRGDDLYDVFVSYGPSEEDTAWVRDVLIPFIDQHERNERSQDPNFAANDVVEDGANDGARCQLASLDGLRVFWEERDVPGGKPEVYSVAEGMEKSSKTLIIVSQAYLKDGRRQFEIESAVHKSITAGHHLRDIILVLRGQSEETPEDIGVRLPAPLQPILRDNSHLTWTPENANGQNLFWESLRDRLCEDRHEPGHVQV